ncbi:MAG: enoyl-CoA hydratase [Acidimicrobiales bacterium]
MTDLPTEGVLLAEVADRVAVVTLNRPEARNALNREIQRRLPALLADLDADADVDVVILTGADPAFSAGVDLKELGSGSKDLVLPKDRRGPFPPRTKPLIGAINGVAVTGGFELALACDFLVASERARFADTHARVGVMPGWGLTVLLPQAVGVRRARELSITGNQLDAHTALVWGLVNHVVPHGELLAFCRVLAADIVSNDQAGVRRMLATYEQGGRGTADEAWALEARVAREWAADALDPAEVERRRRGILARGRDQLGGP